MRSSNSIHLKLQTGSAIAACKEYCQGANGSFGERKNSQIFLKLNDRLF